MPWVEGAYAPAVRALGEFLRRPEIHGELEIHGRIFLSAVILKFNVFQRFFISAAQYDRTLEDKMPEIIDELIPHLTELLLEDRFRRDVLARVEKALTGFLSDPSSSLFIARSLGDIVRDELKKPLAEFPWFAAGGFGKKAGGLLKRLIGEEGNAGTIVSVFSAKFIERYGSLGLGAFLMTGAEQKEALNVFISEKLLAAAGSRAEEILSAVSVRTMIRERIDSLEMERVEGIILDVMARELKWIDIFGAILGFLIGVSQLALTRIPGLF
jgi:hypothetical protein